MFTGNEDHVITLAEGAEYTARYRNTLMAFLGGVKGEVFSQAGINAILAQEGVVGIRIYLGLSDDLIPLPALVLVGVDAAGNDLTAGVILERGNRPPAPILNPLNS